MLSNFEIKFSPSILSTSIYVVSNLVDSRVYFTYSIQDVRSIHIDTHQTLAKILDAFCHYIFIFSYTRCSSSVDPDEETLLESDTTTGALV